MSCSGGQGETRAEGAQFLYIPFQYMFQERFDGERGKEDFLLFPFFHFPLQHPEMKLGCGCSQRCCPLKEVRCNWFELALADAYTDRTHTKW